MAILSHFTLNSDFTAIKEAHDFTLTLNVGSKNLASMQNDTQYIDIYVPAGAYIENITLNWSKTNDTVPSAVLVYDQLYGYGMVQSEIALFRQNATTYRLMHYSVNMDANSHTIGGYTITAKAHLFYTNE